MKKNLKLALTFLLFVMQSYALQAQNCNCTEMFSETVQTYEENYSLFIYKVTEENKNLYQAHTDLMRAKSVETDNIDDCKLVLEKWLDFFRDKHNYILKSSDYEGETYNESIDITESDYRKNYQKNSYQLNPLFGIWQNGGYKVAIIPNSDNSKRKRDFLGVILESGNPNWKQGEVKFELISNFGTSYQINYLMGNHSIEKLSAQQTDPTTFEIKGLNSWTKIWPEVKGTKEKSEIEAKFGQFHITYIDDIPYLRLPDFYSVDRNYVDSMMRAHHEKIIAADFMVVDVRQNGGGNDGTYFPVLPYLLTGPIELPTNGFWLSEYNSQTLLKYLAAEYDLTVEEYAKQEKDEYERFMSNKGKAYFKGSEMSWTFSTDTLFSGPTKVAILIDSETGSSGETFVYRTNQSDKVVVYGQNTAGVVDGFNGLSKSIGCFEVVFPSSYRAKDIKENPIDPYGIAPDVYIDKDEDALSYAIEHMKQLINIENN